MVWVVKYKEYEGNQVNVRLDKVGMEEPPQREQIPHSGHGIPNFYFIILHFNV